MCSNVDVDVNFYVENCVNENGVDCDYENKV